ncbi:MAG: Lrp/AsnC family leucine-responsive transcriptional regulator [Verrucomicrobiales bacterium]|jgi:Lrp/AsnC family leucine-responsive transcriptional regulator
MIALDDIDHTILSNLQTDGRLTNADLAESIGLSASACHRRVRRLEADGVIERYAALVNRELVGRGVSVFVEISLESQREELLDAFEAAVSNVPHVQSCHLMAGNADYLVHVTCADVADYETIHREYIAVLPGVTQVRSSFAIRTITDSTALDLERR